MNLFRCLVEAIASAFRPLHQTKRGSVHVETPQPSATSQAQPVPDFSSTAQIVGEPNGNPVESSAVPLRTLGRAQTLPHIMVSKAQDLGASIGGASSSASSKGLSPSQSLSSERNSETTLSLSHDGTTLHARRSCSSSKSSTVSMSDKLKEKLRRARVERGSLKFFVPREDIEALITEATVTKILEDQGYDRQTAALNVSKTCACAKSLFATLVYLDKGGEIPSFLEEGISDADHLPFIRPPQDTSFQLQTKTGLPIKTFEQWTPGEREEFYRTQWWMTAPVFEYLQHYNLDENDVLPFLPLTADEEEKYRRDRGGYGQVYPARVHPAHHNFHDLPMPVNSESGPIVAIKKLSSSDKKQFEQEASILKYVGKHVRRKNDSHLIKLLATFQQGEHYHLVFPFADSNLLAYWDDRELPEFNKETVLWSLKQMAGLASGLAQIHNFEVTIPLSVSGNVRVQRDAKLQVKGREERYGRHGDNKPENIMWFQHMTGVDDANGVLQIADLGLGRFHGRESRSGIDPKTIATSPTYEPPECRLRRPVSRAYDLWSLGCVYLEFVTWLLLGSKAIQSFADNRAKHDPQTGISEDNFFTILGPDEAEVAEGVVTWVNQLHSHDRCSQAIHDLLDLVMTDLIVIDSEDRIPSTLLSGEMKSLLDKAQKDEQYLLKPVPRPQTGVPSDLRPQSTTSSSSGRNVRFPDKADRTNPNAVKIKNMQTSLSI